MATIRAATKEQQCALDRCLAYLRMARNAAASADSPRALGKIRAAIKSAGGAKRHMQHRLNRGAP